MNRALGMVALFIGLALIPGVVPLAILVTAIRRARGR